MTIWIIITCKHNYSLIIKINCIVFGIEFNKRDGTVGDVRAYVCKGQQPDQTQLSSLATWNKAERMAGRFTAFSTRHACVTYSQLPLPSSKSNGCSLLKRLPAALQDSSTWRKSTNSLSTNKLSFWKVSLCACQFSCHKPRASLTCLILHFLFPYSSLLFLLSTTVVTGWESQTTVGVYREDTQIL